MPTTDISTELNECPDEPKSRRSLLSGSMYGLAAVLALASPGCAETTSFVNPPKQPTTSSVAKLAPAGATFAPSSQTSDRSTLHFYWVVDRSGSMSGEKIATLNTAIRQAVPLLREAIKATQNIDVLVHLCAFSDGAALAKPVPLAEFEWFNLSAGGGTAMGRALTVVSEDIRATSFAPCSIPPVLVMLSDGEPTDSFERGLQSLTSHEWGKKSLRIAVAIGRDASLKVLQAFIGRPDLQPLPANDPQTLVDAVTWVSSEVTKTVASSAVASRTGTTTSCDKAPDIVIPPPPPKRAPSLTQW